MLTQEDIKNIKDSLTDSLQKSLATSLKESLKDTFVTKDYFDNIISHFLENMITKDDLMAGLTNLDDSLSSLENKMNEKFKEQARELKDYTHQSFEAQQEYLDERFNELIVDYDVRDRVEKLEKGFYQHKLNKPYRV